MQAPLPRQCDFVTWTWQPNYRFDVVHTGLASDAEFLANMARLQDGSSYWFKIYQIGKLGLNNAGYLSMALQASSLLPVQGCASEQRACRTTPRAQLPPAAPPRRPHHHHSGRGVAADGVSGEFPPLCQRKALAKRDCC